MEPINGIKLDIYIISLYLFGDLLETLSRFKSQIVENFDKKAENIGKRYQHQTQ